MKRVIIWPLLFAMVPLMPAAAGSREPPIRLVQSSEVFVPQTRGRMPNRAAGPGVPLPGSPEGKPPSADDGARQPVNCTAANAASPECYSATQQSRPPTR